MKYIITEEQSKKLWLLRRHKNIEELLNLVLRDMEDYGKVNVEDYIMIVIEKIAELMAMEEGFDSDFERNFEDKLAHYIYNNFKEKIELDYSKKYG